VSESDGERLRLDQESVIRGGGREFDAEIAARIKAATGPDRSAEHHVALEFQLVAMHRRAQLAEARAERAEKAVRQLTRIQAWFLRRQP
jgi:hypothetical protein